VRLDGRGRQLAAVVAGLVLGVSLGACGDDTARPAPEEEVTTMPSSPPGSKNPAVREAVADLATRLDVDEADVTVVSVEEVTWHDGSLGCAKEGMMYTQALVDGSRIVLEVDSKRYEYHQGSGRVFYCEKPTQ
jgi:hypothetical protein